MANKKAKGTVMITGSSKGLGRNLAVVFARNKYNVIIHGRDAMGLKNLREELIGKEVICDVVTGDLTMQKTIDALYKAARKRDLDILVNNAGIYLNKPLDDSTDRDIMKVIDTNLIAPVLLTKRLYPIFREKRRGLIININSLAGKTGSGNETAYCAAKHGLRGFSRALQFEATKYNIRIMDFYPGSMGTSMIAGRKDFDKSIDISEAADLIVRLCRNYPSMRVTEIELLRRKYSP